MLKELNWRLTKFEYHCTSATGFWIFKFTIAIKLRITYTGIDIIPSRTMIACYWIVFIPRYIFEITCPILVQIYFILTYNISSYSHSIQNELYKTPAVVYKKINIVNDFFNVFCGFNQVQQINNEIKTTVIVFHVLTLLTNGNRKHISQKYWKYFW